MNDSATTVRSAVTADASTLSALAEQTFALACPTHADRVNIEQYVATELSEGVFKGLITDGRHAVLIAANGTEPVGYAVLTQGAPPHEASSVGSWCCLQRIYVLSEAHGSPVSARLLRTSEATARSLGHTAIWLGTNRENARALSFYAKHGFRVVGERDFRLGPEIHCDLVLSKRL